MTDETWGEYEICVAYNLSRQSVRNWGLPAPDAATTPRNLWPADTVRAWVAENRPEYEERA